MAKIPSYHEWIKKQNGKWKTPEEGYLTFFNKVLIGHKNFPPFYTAEQAKQDLYAALEDALDGFAKLLDTNLAKPGKPNQQNQQKGGGPGAKGGGPGAKGGGPGAKGGGPGAKGGAGGKSGETGSGTTRGAKGGSKGVSVGVEEGNQIIDSKKAEKPEPYNNKVEFGNFELRKLLQPLPKNPDLVMKGDADSEMDNDAVKWGVARLTGHMEIKQANLDEFDGAQPGSIWLGFVRIGKRVEQNHDALTLVQLVPAAIAGRKYIILASELKGGEPWHSTWLNRKFAAKADPAIKKWNGWTLQDLKTDKKLELSDTGSFFGFFLIKAADGGKKHYWNFRCASLNRPANSLVSDHVPDIEPKKMDADQRAALQSVIEAASSGFGIEHSHLHAQFVSRGIKLRRGILGVDRASKKMPLSWAKAVIETLTK